MRILAPAFAHQRAFCSCSNIVRDNVEQEGSNTFSVRPVASRPAARVARDADSILLLLQVYGDDNKFIANEADYFFRAFRM